MCEAGWATLAARDTGCCGGSEDCGGGGCVGALIFTESSSTCFLTSTSWSGGRLPARTMACRSTSALSRVGTLGSWGLWTDSTRVATMRSSMSLFNTSAVTPAGAPKPGCCAKEGAVWLVAAGMGVAPSLGDWNTACWGLVSSVRGIRQGYIPAGVAWSVCPRSHSKEDGGGTRGAGHGSSRAESVYSYGRVVRGTAEVSCSARDSASSCGP